MRILWLILLLSFHSFLLLGQTAPSIDNSSSSPLNGEEDVSIRITLITIEFDQSLATTPETSRPTITINGNSPTDINGNINYIASIEGINNDRIEVRDLNLEYDEIYTIKINNATSTDATPVTAGELTYTFTTGSAVSVNNAVTSNICIGDPDGAKISNIVISENLKDNFYTTSASGNTHTLRLDLPTGFEFVNNEGSIDLLENTDIEGGNLRFLPGGSNPKTSVVLEYRLCALPPVATNLCTNFKTNELDVITIKDLMVRATNSNLDPTVNYYLIRSNNNSGSNNDAEMPGLPPSTTNSPTIFATLEVAAGPDVGIFDGNNNEVSEGETIGFCSGGEVAIRFAKPDGAPLVTSPDYNLDIYIEDKKLGADDFERENDIITINTTSVSQFLEAQGLSVALPVDLKAELTPTATGTNCTGFSATIKVDTFHVAKETPVISATNGIVAGGKIVPTEELETKINVNLTGGKLDVLVNGDPYISRTDYGNDFTLDLFGLASENSDTEVEIRYTAFNKDNGCAIGSANNFVFTILTLPRIEAELSILPSYCVYDDATININFSPDNKADNPIITNFTISGDGITGATADNYDPLNGEDSTGYTFSVSAARAAALANDTTAISLILRYENTERVTEYGQVCKDSTYTVPERVCTDVYGCRPCRLGEPCYRDPIDPCDPFNPSSICYDDCLVNSSSEKHSISEYEARAVRPPVCLDPLKLQRLISLRDSLDAVRIAYSSRSAINAVNSNCGSCATNEKCVVIGENCRTVQREVTVQVCNEKDSIGYKDVTSTIIKQYTVQFIDIPDLVFRTVTRNPVPTVLCDDSVTVFLLGGPGDTFENKNFLVFDGVTAPRQLSDYSFTTGKDGLVARDEPYQLIYEFLGNASSCPTSDTLSFRVVKVPEEVSFPTELPTVNDIPTYRYCLNSAIDSVKLVSQPDIEYIWRDERGSPLDTGLSFLPIVETDEEGLTRFTVEKRHILGGCFSGKTDFYIQIGEIPEANFNYVNSCGNKAVFNSNAEHGGNTDQGDILQSIYYNYNTNASSTYQAITDDKHEFTFPAPGVYDVDMVVQTSIGCTDTITKKVTVFDEADYAIDNGKFSYAEDFTSGSNGWISTTDNDNASPQARNSSWGIRELEGLTGWHAFNEQTGSYNDNEYSWVQSPYFNLSNWNSPKLQMDILFDTPELEGAVLQYMIKDCGNTEGSDIWIPVGRANGGLAWYNNGSISSGPGGSITGWSGISKNNNVGSNTSDSWQTVAYDLAGVRAVAGNNLVQFRIAFASLNLGVNRESGRKGFAFTNFIISEKERISLVENFTHINSQDGLRENVSDFSKAREDVVYIEYHTGRPAGDPLYFGYHFAENTSNDGATRAFVYGLDGPGYTVVNGRFQSFDPFTVGWGERQYTQETLLAPAFDLSLDYTYQEGEPLKVKAMAIRNKNIVPLIDTAQQPQLMSLKVAVVEKEVTEYTQDTLRNVFIKYLGQHPGAFEEKTWKAGSSDSLILEEEWQIPVDAESGRFGLVAWIELARDSPEKGPKGLPFNNVFQAAEMSINTELVAVEVLSNRKTLAGNWVVYPNPAADFLQVQRQENIQSAIEWQVVNALGSIVKKGKYIGGNSGFEVNLAGLNAGIYMLQLNSREGQLQKKFVKK